MHTALRLLFLAAALVVSGSSTPAAVPPPPGPEEPQLPPDPYPPVDPGPSRIPIYPKDNRRFRPATGERAIKDRYIVVLDDTRVSEKAVDALATTLTKKHGGELLAKYTLALRGFSVRLPAAAAEALSKNPNVAWVEQDVTGQVDATQYLPNWPDDRIWHLDRIDEREGLDGLDGRYFYENDGWA